MNTLALLFLLISLATLVVFYLAVGRNRQLIIPMGIWATILSVLSYSGFFKNTSTIPPRVAFLFVIITTAAIYLYKKVDTSKINAVWLHGIHIVRIPVELVLYKLFLAGEIPQSMTFMGWN